MTNSGRGREARLMRPSTRWPPSHPFGLLLWSAQADCFARAQATARPAPSRTTHQVPTRLDVAASGRTPAGRYAIDTASVPAIGLGLTVSVCFAYQTNGSGGQRADGDDGDQ